MADVDQVKVNTVRSWIEDLSGHVERMSSRYISQTAYANEVKLSSYFLSMAINRKFGTMSKNAVTELAERTGFDHDNFKKVAAIIESMPMDEWKLCRQITPLAGDAPDTELMNFCHASPIVLPTQDIIPKDVARIEEYLTLRRLPDITSEGLKKAYRYGLLLRLAEDLKNIKECDLC